MTKNTLKSKQNRKRHFPKYKQMPHINSKRHGQLPDSVEDHSYEEQDHETSSYT